MIPFFLYPCYKNSHYPQNYKESFKVKTLEIHWGVKDCHQSIIYAFLFTFLTLFPLNFHRIVGEELSTNTIHTHSKCRELIWSIWETLNSCQFLVEAIGVNARSGKLAKTRLGEVHWQLELRELKYSE